MPYSLNTYDGTNLVTIADGLVDDQVTTPLFLIGKNVTGYGTRQNENFLYLLENFAGIAPPTPAATGQLWFDKTAGATKLNVYDGANWKGLGVQSVSTSQPTTLSLGDLWFDSAQSQLWAKSGTGTAFTLIGPDILSGAGVTKMVAKTVQDINSSTHVILDVTVDDDILGIFSKDAFSIGGNEAEYAAGFTNIIRGLTLRPGASLSGLDIPSRSVNEVISTQWNFSSGIKLGDQTSIAIDTNNNLVLNAPNTSVLINSLNLLPVSVNASIGSNTQPFNQIVANNITSGSAIRPLNILADTVLFTDSKLRPYIDNNVALGTSVSKWKNLYTYSVSAGGPTSNGTLEGNWTVETGGELSSPALITQAFSAGNQLQDGNVTGQWTINPGSTWQATQLIDGNGNALSPDINATPDTVVLRTHYGQINATEFNGAVVGGLTGDTTGTHHGQVIGDVLGNIRATITTSTNIYASTVSATNISGSFSGNISGNVTGNVTGNTKGDVVSLDNQNTLVDATNKIIGYSGAALQGNLIGSLTGNVNSTDGRTVMINATGKQIGYTDANLVGTLTGNHVGNLIATDNTVIIDATAKQIGYTNANLVGKLTGDVTGASSVSSINISATGVLNLSAGNTSANGIKFPADPGGGSGDTAWIRYFAYTGERTNLEIGVSNDAFGGNQDSINLVAPGGVGVNVQTPRYALDVAGDIACTTLHGTSTDSQLWNGSNKFISTSPPTNDQGADGDFWFQREA